LADPRRTELLNDQAFLEDLRGTKSQNILAAKWHTNSATIHKWRKRLRAEDNDTGVKQPTRESFDHDKDGSVKYEVVADRILPLSWWLERMVKDGFDPEDFLYSIGNSLWTQHSKANVTTTLYANRFSASLKNVKAIKSVSEAPEWQPIDRGPALTVKATSKETFAVGGTWKTAILAADTQIGFREFDDDTLNPFHDERAIDIFMQLVEGENPDQTVIMGDILDFASQGRFAQEASFARTTQPAIDRTTLFGAEIRARTAGKIVYIEGNHDKRMQNFVETNAVAAFGLRKGDMPESWPVMSLPSLLRLDEHDIVYKDAYPAAHWWVNDQLRCEHGTKANSKGSTAAQYMNDTPHISRAHGHTHRLEAQSHTTYDRAGKIKSVSINPGCLCRVDGAVPSVNGAIGADGRAVEVFENWQQGVAVVRFKDSGEFFWNLVQIEEGVSMYEGGELRAA
jgi:predicted phosphodiesterase